MAVKQQITVQGRTLNLSRLDKPLYPSGFTKAGVIDYYVRVSGFLLPHLRNRPVTLKRFPDGVHGQSFYEKDAPDHKPEWVTTYPVPRRAGGPDICYVLINDLPTLVWCAQIASLELHPFLHKAPRIDRPSEVVFDLDPGPPADIFMCTEVAFLLKAWFDRRKLKSFVKVSGSKGLQLYVPLNTPVTYDRTRAFARRLAESFEKSYPELCLAAMDKDLRAGKVFIDWSQNADFKTTVGVYSLRAKSDRPYVSLPVTWRELKTALTRRKREALYFEPAEALIRTEKAGDIFAPLLTLKQRLPESEIKTARTSTATVTD